MVNKKVLIIGSGISGLTVAHELIVQGYSVSLIEQDDIIGGMAKPGEKIIIYQVNILGEVLDLTTKSI